MAETVDRSKLAAIARRYYLDGASRVDLAEEFGLSRFKIARLLEQAQELGVVTITIHDDSPIDELLSSRLAAHLGLTEAVVVNAHGRPEAVRQAVGAAAADYLGRTLIPGEVLGLAWGRTLTDMTKALTTLPKVTVVQLTGTIGSNLAESPVEIVRVVAQRSEGMARPIFAPMLVDHASTAAALRKQTDVLAATTLFDKVTTAVVAIGSWEPPISQLRDAASDADRATMRDLGVRAEVTGILVTDDGRIVGEDFTARCLTISAQQLARIPRSIGVVSSSEKAMAVAAIARAGLITTLITDQSLATAVLSLPTNRAGGHAVGFQA